MTAVNVHHLPWNQSLYISVLNHSVINFDDDDSGELSPCAPLTTFDDVDTNLSCDDVPCDCDDGAILRVLSKFYL